MVVTVVVTVMVAARWLKTEQAGIADSGRNEWIEVLVIGMARLELG